MNLNKIRPFDMNYVSYGNCIYIYDVNFIT